MTLSTPLPFPGSEGAGNVFKKFEQEPEIEFAEQFTNLSGRFIYCRNEQEAVENFISLSSMNKWKKLYCTDDKIKALLQGQHFTEATVEALESSDVSITSCECLIARTGSIMLSSAIAGGRTASVYAPVHICIAYTSQLVNDIREGLELISQKYGNDIPSMLSMATGPSRTADIEKTLVVGIHGPGEAYVFLIEDKI